MNDVKNGIVYQESIDCMIRILDEARIIFRPYELIAEWLAGTLPLKVGSNIVLRLSHIDLGRWSADVAKSLKLDLLFL